MFNCEKSPFLRLYFSDQDSVAFHIYNEHQLKILFTWWSIVLRKGSIVELHLIEVAFEASMTLEEAIEEDWKVLIVLKHIAICYPEPHRCRKSLQYVKNYILPLKKVLSVAIVQYSLECQKGNLRSKSSCTDRFHTSIQIDFA